MKWRQYLFSIILAVQSIIFLWLGIGGIAQLLPASFIAGGLAAVMYFIEREAGQSD